MKVSCRWLLCLLSVGYALLLGGPACADEVEVEVPDVRGLSRAEAERRLRLVGLRVGRVEFVDEARQQAQAGVTYARGLVWQQRPPSETSSEASRLPQGDVVDLRITGTAILAEPPRARRSALPSPPPPPPPPPRQRVPNEAQPFAVPPRTDGPLPTLPLTPAAPARRTRLRRRVEVTVEAALGLLESPEGPLGGLDTLLPNEMRWDGLSYAAEPRFRLGLRVPAGACDLIQVRGGWFGAVHDEGQVDGSFAFYPGAGGNGGISQPNQALFTSELDIYGGDAVYWHQLRGSAGARFYVVGGARWLRFDDLARASQWAQPFPGFVSPPLAEAHVRSDWFGGVLGLGYERNLSSRLELRTSGTVLLGNMARDITVRDSSFFAPGSHESSRSESGFALGGAFEIGLRASLSSSLAVTLGYELLYMQELTRASAAMDFGHSDTGAVQPRDAPSDTIAHFFFLGLGFEL